MCELQIIQKLGREKINKADIGEFFKMMCFGSMNNNDAFGVFNHKTMFKDKGAFDASKLDEYDLTSCNFVIGHNRLSTNWTNVRSPGFGKRGMLMRPPSLSPYLPKGTRRGPSAKWNWSIGWKDNMCNIFLRTDGWPTVSLENEEPDINSEKAPEIKKEKCKKNYVGHDKNRNNHPFVLGDFTLIHNGSIPNAQHLSDKYNFQTTINTDSYIILELIDYFFKKSNIKDRVRRIAAAIHVTSKKINGRYSVILYDKKSKNSFYFKNFSTSFSLCKYGDKILCGSTSQENLDYIYFGMKREDIKIKNRRVYMINSDVKSPVTDVTPKTRILNNGSTLYSILMEPDYNIRISGLDQFLKRKLGFIPLYSFTYDGGLKIASNNSDGIKEKIKIIVKVPKKRFGWYVIKAADVKPNDIKLNKMKGGKK